ncbi:MAG: 50S ribosomal protein L25 [Verrucomicrobia subdivision 3 bacterium]|nr:50S ribosomal protein L25 [Limisphaerales bacterium]
MKAIELAANARTAKKRNQVRALRHTGSLPAVIYGSGSGAEQLEVDKKTFQRMMASTSATAVLVDLNLDGNSRLALIQEVQHHPLSRQPLHVDFREVRRDQQVHVTVPIVPMGEAVGVKVGGGNLEHVMRQVHVSGTPDALPEMIEVDITGLDIGDTLHISDIAAPEGVQILDNTGNPVFSVSRPRVEVEVTPAEGEGEEGAEGEEGVAAEGEAKPEEGGGDKK